MEPGIQYATTADGVSIAFWTLGEGAPVMSMPPGSFSHLGLEWQLPEYRRWYERLALSLRVIRYDGRGTGLSERNVADVSPDAWLLDIDAVAERLGLERFGLVGIALSGPTAIAYAAQRPDRVSHLFLWCTYARASDLHTPQFEALGGLIDTDWELFTETTAHAMVAGWEHGELARAFAMLMREAVTAQMFRTMREGFREYDVGSLLKQVKAPTLVLQRRQVPWPSTDMARGLASQIPNARLILLEGSSLLPFVGDMEAVASATEAFLAETEEAGAGPKPRPAAGPGLVTILFTDIEGSTALTERLGDAKAREVLREHERITREALQAHGGSEVKTMGDGFMASFGSATRALECAVVMQRAFAEWNREIRVRIGLNAGEPIAEESQTGGQDLFGTAVIMAARIAGQAAGGEILAANVVRELVAGKGFLFSDRGDTALRGFEDPVRLYEVRWREG